MEKFKQNLFIRFFEITTNFEPVVGDFLQVSLLGCVRTMKKNANPTVHVVGIFSRL
jgi:hypothetical protein